MSHHRVAQSYIAAFNHYNFCFFQIQLLRNLPDFYSIHLKEQVLPQFAYALLNLS